MPSLDDILYSLRYQILTPRVTTMGQCANGGCENTSRGGGVCWVCKRSELQELVGEDIANDYVAYLERAQFYLIAAEQLADEMRDA